MKDTINEILDNVYNKWIAKGKSSIDIATVIAESLTMTPDIDELKAIKIKVLKCIITRQAKADDLLSQCLSKAKSWCNEFIAIDIENENEILVGYNHSKPIYVINGSEIWEKIDKDNWFQH